MSCDADAVCKPRFTSEGWWVNWHYFVYLEIILCVVIIWLNSFQLEYKNHITRLKKDGKKIECRGKSQAREVRENYRVIYLNYSSVGNLQSYLCAFDKTAELRWDPTEVCRVFKRDLRVAERNSTAIIRLSLPLQETLLTVYMGYQCSKATINF